MKRLIIFLLTALMLTSCEKLFFDEDGASTDPYANFDYLWEQVDKKYSYFDTKNINWDNIRTKYRAKLSPTMSEDTLFKVLGNMLNELKDDHVNLISPFNVSMYMVELKYPQNFDIRIVREHYLKDDFMYTGSFPHGFLTGYDKQIGYIRYSSFMNTVDDEALNYILTRYKDTKGLILDLRANGGGAMSNIPMILERFVSEKTLVSYNVTRNGKAHNDFGEREPFYILSSEEVKYTQPVMVLVDRGSYSATTFFSLATKALDNLTLVGDTTGGGGGMPNGGQLPNGWTYRFSITKSLDINRIDFAEDGVPADIYVLMDLTDRTHDAVIERAAQEILK